MAWSITKHSPVLGTVLCNLNKHGPALFCLGESIPQPVSLSTLSKCSCSCTHNSVITQLSALLYPSSSAFFFFNCYVSNMFVHPCLPAYQNMICTSAFWENPGITPVLQKYGKMSLQDVCSEGYQQLKHMMNLKQMSSFMAVNEV